MEVPARLRQARSALLLIFLVHGAFFALLVTRIPAIQDRYGLSDAALPAFLAAVPLLAGAGSLAAVRVVRALPATTVVRTVQPVLCLTLITAGAGDEVWQLALALAVFGLLTGAMEATLNMTAVAIERSYGRSVILRFHGAASLGGIVGSVLAWAGAHWDVPLGVLYTTAALVLMPLAAGVGPRLSRGVGQPGGTAGATGTADAAGTAGAARKSAGSGTGRSAKERGVPWKPLLPLCLIMTVAVVADSTATNWSAKFLEDTLHSSEATATVPYTLYMVATLVGRGLGDGWVRRFGAAAVLRAGALLSAAGFAVVAVAPGPWAGVLGFGVLGAGLSVMIPQLFSLGARTLPGAQDSAIARVNLFNYVGFLIGPPLIGAVGAGVSYRVAMAVPMVLVLAVLVAARAAGRAADSGTPLPSAQEGPPGPAPDPPAGTPPAGTPPTDGPPTGGRTATGAAAP
ncbi:MFS transporter [Streptomyces clavuligerus]|uniref:Major facilitator superfamily permease n=1 Tax=Streptomyces clavuligerus TaxID=1901 RepID=E2Q9D6_STRCL|nr:MFS transporter [Streptomyces clavuligerus]ANW21320.1 transporter [Streptomyces clavuligerus]AXU15947.1 MFS transporter [Streptomyces clavuligerus]EFG05556.1 major facilitator superfamily permease [Streptomyces clavuligerus]MBY6306075.1 MFS transporter [Streptomyces clavuligerus]QCS08727.1 MFS transporter [Streptomyces clavuligerus]